MLKGDYSKQGQDSWIKGRITTTRQIIYSCTETWEAEHFSYKTYSLASIPLSTYEKSKNDPLSTPLNRQDSNLNDSTVGLKSEAVAVATNKKAGISQIKHSFTNIQQRNVFMSLDWNTLCMLWI